jgi:hypothetical protein
VDVHRDPFDGSDAAVEDVDALQLEDLLALGADLFLLELVWANFHLDHVYHLCS